jgi:xylitol oxidase
MRSSTHTSVRRPIDPASAGRRHSGPVSQRILRPRHHRSADDRSVHNWAGNLTFGAARVAEPRSVAELQDLVRGGGRLHAIGTRHSFTDVADTEGTFVSVAGLPRVLEVDSAAGTVALDAGVRYGDAYAALDAAGLAFRNLPSLAHVSVGGACATGTHGSGDARQTLSASVVALDLVCAGGEVVTLRRGEDAAFAGAVVALGALGVITRLVIDVEPSRAYRQDVYERLPLDAFLDRFDQVTSLADSVSCFTTWRERIIDQVWLKRRLDASARDDETPDEVFGARRATRKLNPIPGIPADACTDQLGVPGPWYDRLPHFRLSATPSAGHELQTEYLLPRQHAAAAVTALEPLRDRIAVLVQISEIRTIAADDLWLSPAFGLPVVGIHFTWRPDERAVRALLPEIERLLRPFEPRPHWAKLFAMDPAEVRSRYPRWDGFAALVHSSDPEGRFGNAFLARLGLADAAR